MNGLRLKIGKYYSDEVDIKDTTLVGKFNDNASGIVYLTKDGEEIYESFQSTYVRPNDTVAFPRYLEIDDGTARIDFSTQQMVRIPRMTCPTCKGEGKVEI